MWQINRILLVPLYLCRQNRIKTTGAVPGFFVRWSKLSLPHNRGMYRFFGWGERLASFVIIIGLNYFRNENLINAVNNILFSWLPGLVGMPDL